MSNLKLQRPNGVGSGDLLGCWFRFTLFVFTIYKIPTKRREWMRDPNRPSVIPTILKHGTRNLRLASMLGYIIPAIYRPATNCIATDNHGYNPKAGEIYN